MINTSVYLHSLLKTGRKRHEKNRTVRWVSGLNHRFAKPAYVETRTAGSNPALTAI